MAKGSLQPRYKPQARAVHYDSKQLSDRWSISLLGLLVTILSIAALLVALALIF